MTAVVIKAKPFNYPNYLILEIPGQKDTVAMDVAAAFPSDEAASEFWDSAKAAWLEHVKARRAVNGAGDA